MKVHIFIGLPFFNNFSTFVKFGTISLAPWQIFWHFCKTKIWCSRLGARAQYIIVQTISFGHRPNHKSLNNGTLYFPVFILHIIKK